MSDRKLKLSITLSEGLLRRIDRSMGRSETRSGVIQRWLERAARLEAERELDDATAAYYDSLTRADVAEDDAIARGLSRAARKLAIDEDRPSILRRRRSRG
jgi:metal-responsive CopG/Arc/MetJ family transcriptional regulator